MMKNIIYLIILFISFNVTSQNRYITKTGTVELEASVPSFEEVKAKNNSTTAIINSESGEFAALVLIKGFRFKNALMEEHFNENYAESDVYTKANFKGKIDDFSVEKLSANPQTFNLEGVLTFHGKSKTLEELTIQIVINEDVITISGKFLADASDFDIKIPKIVRSKINEEIKVSFEFKLQKK
jgi:YceI-like protein